MNEDTTLQSGKEDRFFVMLRKSEGAGYTKEEQSLNQLSAYIQDQSLEPQLIEYRRIVEDDKDAAEKLLYHFPHVWWSGQPKSRTQPNGYVALEIIGPDVQVVVLRQHLASNASTVVIVANLAGTGILWVVWTGATNADEFNKHVEDHKEEVMRLATDVRIEKPGISRFYHLVPDLLAYLNPNLVKVPPADLQNAVIESSPLSASLLEVIAPAAPVDPTPAPVEPAKAEPSTREEPPAHHPSPAADTDEIAKKRIHDLRRTLPIAEEMSRPPEPVAEQVPPTSVGTQDDSISPDQANDSQHQENPQPVVLVPEAEEAYGLWLLRKNQKTGDWHFSGIYQNAVFELLNQYGFYKRYAPDGNSVFFLHNVQSIISEVITTRMRDCVKDHIDSDNQPVGTEMYQITYAARSEKMRRTSNSLFNEKSLQELPTHFQPILQDTPQICYLPFSNGIVEISKDGIELKPYASLRDACVWKGQVITRPYNPAAPAQCDISDYIGNVSNQEDDRIQAFRTAIGYAIHSHNAPSEGQAIICCDEELSGKSKPQGGTGKGIFVNAIKQIRPVAYIDGKKFSPDSQFCFQAVNRDTRVVWIDDVKADFSFERFFSVLTAGWTIEKKNQAAYTIPQPEGPKLVICTNTPPNNEGSSNIRRQFILEFSDYYKRLIKPGQKSHPIREIHGRDFFTDEWDEAEWERFDKYMVDCVLAYIKSGLLPYKTHNVSSNRLLQTTSEEFCAWATSHDETGLQPDRSYRRPDLLTDYRTFAGLSEKELPSRRFTDYIKRFADSRGWIYRLGNSNNNPTFTLESNP